MKQKKSKGSSRWFKGAVTTTISIVCLAALAFVYISTLISPESLWIVVPFQVAFPIIVTLNIAALILCAVKKSKFAFIIAALLLPAIFIMPRYLHIFSHDSTEEGAIKIISYNVGAFHSSGDESLDYDITIDRIFSSLKAQHPDIVCLQEVWVQKNVKPESIARKYFPSYHVLYSTCQGHSAKAGLMIITRFPVGERNSLRYKGTTNLTLWTDIDINGTMVRIFNCHLESYRIPLDKFKNVDDDAIAYTKEKIKYHAGKRPVQVDSIVDNIKQNDIPAIILGDFNDTPVSYSYNRLVRGRKDSFVEAGNGIGATFRKLWPALRIDYVLYPGEILEARTHRTPQLEYSDHYPVIVTFDMVNKDKR